MAKRMNKPVVLFDMMGVIFTEGRFSRLINELIPDSDLDLIRRRYRLYRIGKINNSRFWRGLTENPKVLEARFLHRFKLDSGFFPLIRRLKKDRRYGLAILSNIPLEWKAYLLKKFRFRRYFDAAFFSCDVGLAKPDKRFYRLALKKLGADPADVIFIDDELGNLIPAAKIGMTTAYIERRADKTKFKPDFKVRGLSQLSKTVRL